MPKTVAEAEAELKKLADLLHRGWEKRCPPTQGELDAVLRVVREHSERKLGTKKLGRVERKIIAKQESGSILKEAVKLLRKSKKRATAPKRKQGRKASRTTHKPT